MPDPDPGPDSGSVTVYGAIRPTGQPDAETRRIQATGTDYPTAHDALTAQVPEGWQLIGVSTWPA